MQLANSMPSCNNVCNAFSGLRRTYADLVRDHQPHAGRITFADFVFLATAEGANKGLQEAGKLNQLSRRN